MELGLTESQLHAMLSTLESPYIRAIGFLYIRYVMNPQAIWDWISDYVDDEEEFRPSPYGGSTSMGAYVRDLFIDMYYFETILPRIPVAVVKNLKTQLLEAGLPTEAVGNGGLGGASRRGNQGGGNRPVSVKSALTGGNIGLNIKAAAATGKG